MTLVNVNPTILEECQLRMHVDHVENMICDSYIIEFAYYPTCNYYEREKYGYRNVHVTELPLVMLNINASFFLFIVLHFKMLIGDRSPKQHT